MAHTTSSYYRDRLGFEPEYESQMQAQQHTSVTKSSLYTSSRTSQEVRSSSSHTGREVAHSHNGSSSQAAAAANGSSSQVQHYSSHHSSQSQQQQQLSKQDNHGVYEESMTKFKGLSPLLENT